MFDEYRKAVVGTLAPFSGQFIVRQRSAHYAL
jgi:hypothetical protein